MPRLRNALLLVMGLFVLHSHGVSSAAAQCMETVLTYPDGPSHARGVAIADDVMAFVTDRRVKIYQFADGQWSPTQVLTDTQSFVLALQDEYLLVGGVFGEADVYHRGPTQWSRTGMLITDDLNGGNKFGRAVALDGSLAVVGSTNARVVCADGELCTSGAAYIFERLDGGTPNDPFDDVWIERQKLSAPVAQEHDNFGRSARCRKTMLPDGR